MKKYYIPLLLVSCMLFSGCNKNSVVTPETTQSTSSKELSENINTNCTYIAYRNKVIILDNKNNTAKLSNLNDIKSSDKVINYSYEDMCNLIDQLSIDKIHISGPYKVSYSIYYAHDPSVENSQKINNTEEDKDFDLSNADMTLDELKIIIDGNKKIVDENYDKVLVDCLTAVINAINSQGVDTISVISNAQSTETTK